MINIRTLLSISLLALSIPSAFADSFGGSFGGSLLGSFGGTMMGNAISNRPRRCERVIVEERPVVHRYVETPVQTRVVHEVHHNPQQSQSDQKLSALEKEHKLEVQTLKAELAEAKARIKELEFENQHLTIKSKL